MNWFTFTGIFFLGGLAGIFVIGLFAVAMNGFPKQPSAGGKDKKIFLS